MAKISSTFVCQQCGYQSPQLLGRCPECGAWNSLVEQVIENQRTNLHNKKTVRVGEIIELSSIEKKNYSRLNTGIGELDRVLGGGIVMGSLILVSGDPGIGKSTLLSQLALNINNHVIASAAKSSTLRDEPSGLRLDEQSSMGENEDKLLLRNKNKIATLRQAQGKLPRNDGGVLYVSGEESAHQIKIRIERLKKDASLAVLNEIDVDIICKSIEDFKPKSVVVDSIQTLETQDLSSVAGSVGQVRESAHRLQRLAKMLHIPIFLVGHVTKEGNVAGPKTLEHMVDVVLSLEGDPNNQFRILRANKNRFGSTDEVGIFEMEESGMMEVINPSKLFLAQKIDAPGSAVVATLNGLRPMLLEVQALVTKTNLAIPRRVATGVDNNKLQLLVAVLTKRLNLPLYSCDVYVNVTGGIKISEPAADLAICMAIISSFKDKALPKQSVFIGEVGLLGELRAVRELGKRTTEAKKLGFKNIISSENAKSLSQAVRLALE